MIRSKIWSDDTRPVTVEQARFRRALGRILGQDAWTALDHSLNFVVCSQGYAKLGLPQQALAYAARAVIHHDRELLTKYGRLKHETV